MKVAVCSTVAAYKCDGRSEMAWLDQAAEWGDVEWFCALQVGQGHDEKLDELRLRLYELGATVWTFSIDDGFDTVTTGSRLKAICAGRNLCHEFVNEHQDITHLLFLDSDTAPPADLIEKLAEIDHPIVGAHVPTYGLDGPKVLGSRVPEGADVREHDLQTAGCLLLTREAVNSIRWGWNVDAGLTDDPWTEQLAEKVGLGKVWVRHDVVCRHYPDAIGPLEARWHDLSIKR